MIAPIDSEACKNFFFDIPWSALAELTSPLSRQKLECKKYAPGGAGAVVTHQDRLLLNTSDSPYKTVTTGFYFNKMS